MPNEAPAVGIVAGNSGVTMWCYAYLTNGTVAWPIQEKGLATAYIERRYVWEPPWQIVNGKLREKHWRRGLFGEYRKRHGELRSELPEDISFSWETQPVCP